MGPDEDGCDRCGCAVRGWWGVDERLAVDGVRDYVNLEGFRMMSVNVGKSKFDVGMVKLVACSRLIGCPREFS